MVWLLLGSANRDGNQFPYPDVFNPDREMPRNLAFGDGIHRCVGASLAELETAIALKTLYKNFPDLAIAGDTIDFKQGFGLRGPVKLPVLLGAKF